MAANWKDASRGCGLVLAGGLSRRMGSDKASMRLADGTSLLEHAWQTLTAALPHTWVACARGQVFPDFPCLEDLAPGFGPAGAIYSALEKLPAASFILPLPCDMPLMTPAVLRHLLRAHASAPGALATMFAGLEPGRIETLPAIYSAGALPWFRQAVAQKRRSLWNLVPLDRQQHIECPPAFRKYFFNCNTPEEFAQARQLLARLPRQEPDKAGGEGEKGSDEQADENSRAGLKAEAEQPAQGQPELGTAAKELPEP